jgi:hypothetical protein
MSDEKVVHQVKAPQLAPLDQFASSPDHPYAYMAQAWPKGGFWIPLTNEPKRRTKLD